MILAALIIPVVLCYTARTLPAVPLAIFILGINVYKLENFVFL